MHMLVTHYSNEVGAACSNKEAGWLLEQMCSTLGSRFIGDLGGLLHRLEEVRSLSCYGVVSQPEANAEREWAIGSMWSILRYEEKVIYDAGREKQPKE